MSAGPDPAIRVLVVDDHPIWREGTARYLSEAGYTIAGTAGDGAQALRIIAATRPDVVLLDLNLPDESGAEVARRLLAAQPSARVLMLSASGAQQDVLDAVSAGAVGYVLKSAQLTELVDAVRSAAAGHPVFTPVLAGLVLGEYRRLVRTDAPSPSANEDMAARKAEHPADRTGDRDSPAGGQGPDLPADRPAPDVVHPDRAESCPQHPDQASAAQQGTTGSLRPGKRRGLTRRAPRARADSRPCPRSSPPAGAAASRVRPWPGRYGSPAGAGRPPVLPRWAPGRPANRTAAAGCPASSR